MKAYTWSTLDWEHRDIVPLVFSLNSSTPTSPILSMLLILKKSPKCLFIAKGPVYTFLSTGVSPLGTKDGLGKLVDSWEVGSSPTAVALH
jgi:hypothetical protein